MKLRLLITLTEKDTDLFGYFNNLPPRERAPAARMLLRGLQYQNIPLFDHAPEAATSPSVTPEKETYQSNLSNMIKADLS